MITTLKEILKTTLGLEHGFLQIIYMVLRGIILYTVAILLLRLKLNRKLIGTRTPINFILFMMLGSLAAAGITGGAPFLAVLITIISLMIFNRYVGALLFIFPSLEKFFVGSADILIHNGNIQWENMKKNYITHTDLLNAMREQLHTNDLSQVEAAYLATDGNITFITKHKA